MGSGDALQATRQRVRFPPGPPILECLQQQIKPYAQWLSILPHKIESRQTFC